MARRAGEALDTLSTAVTWPGYPPQNRVVPPLVAVIIGALCGARMAAFQLAAWGVMPIGLLIKQLVRRPRPLKAMLPTEPHRASGSSFPSTHVAMYTAFYGFTAWALSQRGGPSRLAAIGPLTLIAVIGPSRVREGKHHASDVVAGYLLGAAWLGLLIGLERSTAAAAEESGPAEGGDVPAAVVPVEEPVSRPLVAV
jgi:undecaprenyl-diphosphatase